MEKVSFPIICPKCLKKCATNYNYSVFYCPVQTGCGFLFTLRLDNQNNISYYKLWNNGHHSYEWSCQPDKEYFSPFSQRALDIMELLEFYG